MCVALPGKVIDVVDTKAIVDFSGNTVEVYIGLVDVKVDDYVLVHAGCVIQKLSKSQADEIVELMGEME